jgi:hypothetical protein
MEKEEKNRDWRNNGDYSQEDSSKEMFGFVNDFFTSEVKNDFKKETSIKEREQKKRKKEFNNNDQSVTFFLPDYFTHED